MKTKFYFGLVLVLSLVALSCAPNSPKREAPIESNGSAAINAEVKTYDLTPKVDILVVIDYSMSMYVHQENLSRNIDAFVHSFADNQLVDFHFAMVPIWDSVHFDQDVHGQTFRNHAALGELLQLKNPNYDPKDTSSKEYIDGPRYVTKTTPNYIEVMKKTLLLGEQPGPAFEEVFTPILPALSSNLAKGPNQGFYRSDANLIVIIISDTDDGRVEMSPELLAEDLFKLKNGNRNKVAVVGVLSPSTNKFCEKDNGGPEGPKRIEELIRKTNWGQTKNRELDLCSKNFAAGLSNIGADLSVRIPQQVIRLPNLTDFNPELSGASLDNALVVLTGKDVMKKAVAPNFDDGWNFDPSNQSITIGTKTKITGQLKISFTPVHLYNANHGHIQVQK